MTPPDTDTRWFRAMTMRDPAESHRSATPLELFFDLCFVVAIALAATELHHALAHGHVWDAYAAYALIFFAIWWAWMNFTWFASAYDTDDAPYRLKVFVQMAGVLLLAAGVPRAFEHWDFTIITFGYVIMRVPLVAHWFRAARNNPGQRTTALRYAIGVALVQVLWVLILLLPEPWWLRSAIVLVVLELLIPGFAERAGKTPWHAHHIAERYGLLTLIVLGETVLAATVAIQTAFDADHASPALWGTIAGTLLVLFSMWWLYFNEPVARLLGTMRVAFLWGYGHLLVFGSVAAVGAGVAVYIDNLTGEAHLTRFAAAMPFTGAVAFFVLMVLVLHQWPSRRDPVAAVAYVLAAAAVGASALTAWPIPVSGGVLAGLVGFQIRRDQQSEWAAR